MNTSGLDTGMGVVRQQHVMQQDEGSVTRSSVRSAAELRIQKAQWRLISVHHNSIPDTTTTRNAGQFHLVPPTVC
jgi:hypothetical protein